MARFRSSGAFRALSYPNYFWFWSSYFVSNVGSWMQGIAQGWLLFDLTSSPFYLGLFSSLRMVMLLSFFILGGIMMHHQHFNPYDRDMKELRFEFGVRYWLVDQWKGYTTVDKHLKATTHMID